MTVYTAAITLFLVMDPLGNIPVFLTVLENVDPGRRRRVIVREMVIALAVLTLFLFFGKYILQGLHISEPALSIAGGVILFLIALKMIFPVGDVSVGVHDHDPNQEPLVVPLAVPLVAGPSAMAMVILIATQYPERMLTWFMALLIAWVASSAILLSADVLRRYLGRRAIKAMERLMGMILTTVAIEMLLRGIETYLG
ncbi:MAG: NAAT family transporter [Spirochaetales bacterium]|nr:MAG: NAAT family transporter [Spirochaetales bacterium]